jgi:hypothetical protein
MAGALGNLLIMLTADTAQATSDIGKAAHQVERDMADMQRNATAAGMLIAEAIGNIAASFGRAAKEAVQFGDQLNKMSQRTSFSVERLSEMAFAAELADVSVSQMSTALGMFNKVLSDAQKEGSKTAEIFRALGVDITQGPQVAFDQFAKAINTLQDGETKVATMRAVFGRAGDALIPMIKGLDDATEKAQKLGLVMSGQMAADAERFNDAMTVLGTTMRSLGLMAMEPMVGWLANVAEGMGKARAEGNLMKNTILELGMIWASMWGGAAEKLGAGNLAAVMESEFRRLKQLQDGMRPAGATPGASGSWGDGGPGGAADQDALQRALNCGKDKTGKVGKQGMTLEELMQKGADTRVKVYEDSERKLSEIAEREEAERQRLHQEGMKAYFKSIDDRIEAEENAMRLIGGFDEQGRKIKEETKKTNDLARELGLSFTSAFEDSIVEGKKFSDVLRGLGQDILRIATRKLVTEPLGGMASDLFKGIFSGMGGDIFEGIGGALPSFAVGTPSVPRDMVAMIHKGERIIPASQNNGMGGGPTIYADMRGASVEAVQRLEQMVMALDGSIEPRAVSAVADTRRRGGSMARSF